VFFFFFFRPNTSEEYDITVRREIEKNRCFIGKGTFE